MQDITKAKCDSSSIPIGTEGRLIDKRDNKVYWVAKLKDGLCWMTQNLDYDGGAVAGYTGSDVTVLTAGMIFNNDTINLKQYYDPGEYIYTNGSSRLSCDSNTDAGLSICVNKGWVSKEELYMNWQSTDDLSFINATSYPSTDNRETCIKTAGAIIGNSGQYLYCNLYYGNVINTEHYLAGNYYNWHASVNDITAVSGNINTSICPSGWSLPLSGNSNDGEDGAFYRLVNGLTNTQIMTLPYYFVYSGSIYGSALRSAGNDGRYWSATTYDTSNAYNLSISNLINPSSYSYDYSFGLSVRCVAR